MSLWSRILEAVSAVGNSLAAALDHMRPQPKAPEKSIAFTIGMIALSAKMAKADGVVTNHEIEAFKQVFEIEPGEYQNVARVFNLARQEVTGFESYARQVAKVLKSKPALLEDVMDGLFHIAKADGAVHERELAFLMEVAAVFGFSDEAYGRIRARHVSFTGHGAYAVLGLDPAASNEDVKRVWRKLVRDNHPDKHIAAGMPPEAVKIATERLAKINAAYEQIARERGL